MLPREAERVEYTGRAAEEDRSLSRRKTRPMSPRGAGVGQMMRQRTKTLKLAADAARAAT